jgi:hypothetical protein
MPIFDKTETHSQYELVGAEYTFKLAKTQWPMQSMEANIPYVTVSFSVGESGAISS